MTSGYGTITTAWKTQKKKQTKHSIPSTRLTIAQPALYDRICQNITNKLKWIYRDIAQLWKIAILGESKEIKITKCVIPAKYVLTSIHRIFYTTSALTYLHMCTQICRNAWRLECLRKFNSGTKDTMSSCRTDVVYSLANRYGTLNKVDSNLNLFSLWHLPREG